MVNSEKFGNRLQKIMDEYDLNATNFADRIDVGRSSISHILSGRNKPSLEFVMKVIDTFPEVELYWLLNGKGSFPKTLPAPENPTITKQKEQTLFDVPESKLGLESPQPSSTGENTSYAKKDRNGKTINRIVIFYTDGTFENYNPE